MFRTLFSPSVTVRRRCEHRPVAVLYVASHGASVTFILAHKGMSEKAPENTLPSFRMALDSGADGFEEDVQMTMDCVPVISHS